MLAWPRRTHTRLRTEVSRVWTQASRHRHKPAARLCLAAVAQDRERDDVADAAQRAELGVGPAVASLNARPYRLLGSSARSRCGRQRRTDSLAHEAG
jgi:hypothetical protein